MSARGTAADPRGTELIASPGVQASDGEGFDDLPPEAGEDAYFPGREYEAVFIASGDQNKRVNGRIIATCEIDGQTYACITTLASLTQWGRLHADRCYYRVAHRTRPGGGPKFCSYYLLDHAYGKYQKVVDAIQVIMLAELQVESPERYARYIARHRLR